MLRAVRRRHARSLPAAEIELIERPAAAIISRSPGPAGDVYDDLPVPGRRWLRRHPWWLGVIGSVALAMIATVGQAYAERSLSEGLQRGTAEGLIALIGYVLLGSAIGLFTRRSGACDAP